jgi:hypothetical protein
MIKVSCDCAPHVHVYRRSRRSAFIGLESIKGSLTFGLNAPQINFKVYVRTSSGLKACLLLQQPIELSNGGY